MPPADRLVGVDLARSLALLGMCVVHAVLVLGPPPTDGGTAAAFDRLSGRPAALFVLLAGVGVTLMTRRAVAAGDTRGVRRTLVRRGLALLVLGTLNLVIWPGDILRVYGVALVVAAWLVPRRDSTLLVAAGTAVVGFLLLMAVFDFEAHWDWATLTYRGLWTPGGFVRNLFFDGFRTVFPWAGLVFVGMWLGRRNLSDWRLLVGGLAVLATTEFASAALVRHFLARPGGLTPEEVAAVFGTESIPPLPLFLLAAGGTAVAVLGGCVRAGRPDAAAVRVLATPGRFALTWYLLHVVVGLGGAVALGLPGTLPVGVAAAAGAGFWLAAVAVSWVYARRWRVGPVEAVLRAVAG